MKATFVRTIFALSAKLHLLLYQFDVETAFLNPDVDTDIYVEQPPHFNLRRYSRSRYVCKLNKALYGLHQFGYLWFNDVKRKLISLDFEKSDADESIFVLSTPESGHYIVVDVYVDDFQVGAKFTDDIDWLNRELNKDYVVRNLG